MYDDIKRLLFLGKKNEKDNMTSHGVDFQE